MCGRYASSRQPGDLVEEFEISNPDVPDLPPDYNVAPTKPVYAVVERPRRPDANEPEVRERQLRAVTWGLIPSWAKDTKIASKLINARVETVAERPSYRAAFAKRRTILPADGYYEWYQTSQRTASGRPRKQPYFIAPADGRVLAMAGLYEIWRDPELPDDHPERFRWTCTVLTTRAADDLGQIHDRMPMMVAAENYDAWLDPTNPGNGVVDLLVPAAPGTLVAQPVSSLVSHVTNNGPELVRPIDLDEGAN